MLHLRVRAADEAGGGVVVLRRVRLRRVIVRRVRRLEGRRRRRCRVVHLHERGWPQSVSVGHVGPALGETKVTVGVAGRARFGVKVGSLQ